MHVVCRLRVQAIDAALDERRGFLRREEFLAGEFSRTFERRVGVVGPESGQIGPTVRAERPLFPRDGRRQAQDGDNDWRAPVHLVGSSGLNDDPAKTWRPSGSFTVRAFAT